jgi:hypothetical protein
MTTELEDIISQYYNFKIDFKCLDMKTSNDVYTEDQLKDLLRQIDNSIDRLKQHPLKVYYYSRNVIKGRWEEGEEAISSDPELAYWYIIDILIKSPLKFDHWGTGLFEKIKVSKQSEILEMFEKYSRN